MSDGYLEIGPVILSGIQEWSQLFEPCNWRTFHPVMVEIEDDIILGGVECTVILLGLGFRIRWNHSQTEFGDELSRRVGELMDAEPSELDLGEPRRGGDL